jgi:hypothetical protein
MLSSAIDLFQYRWQHYIFFQTFSGRPINDLALHSRILTGPLLLCLEELWIEYAEVVVDGTQTVYVALGMCYTG